MTIISSPSSLQRLLFFPCSLSPCSFPAHCFLSFFSYTHLCFIRIVFLQFLFFLFPLRPQLSHTANYWSCSNCIPQDLY
ncbi:hypothetical protein BDL97_01G043500 [Sphagnum fallax]|nr:hypothetical protein BDL97_01G043500 [Sphagnum fallax]